MHRRNWDDIRFALAVVRAGSVAGAARILKVNHATVLRRIRLFEEGYGFELFAKTPSGYIVHESDRPLIESLEAVEKSVLAAERMFQGRAEPLAGEVRITSTDTLTTTILPEVLSEIQSHAADLKLELQTSNTHSDFARMQSELTVRPALSLPEELDGEIVAQMGLSVYGIHPAPKAWLGLSGLLAASGAGKWMADKVPPDQIAGSADSFVSLREMAASGLGRVLLPNVVGAVEPRLKRLDIPVDVVVDLWVACHVDFASVPRIRRVRAMLVEALTSRQDWLLTGTSGKPSGAL